MRDVTCSFIAVLVSLNVAALVGQTVTIDFDKDQAGQAPARLDGDTDGLGPGEVVGGPGQHSSQ